MEQILQSITKEDECKETDIVIPGELFKKFITPVVEITLAVGKIDVQTLDPLIAVTPQGMAIVAKTVRQTGDGEGAVFFATKQVKSPVLSYICMDFTREFLTFCRNVKAKDQVAVQFNKEFYFINMTRVEKIKEKGYTFDKEETYIYKATANSIEDIQKETMFAVNLFKTVPEQWTAKLTVPAREVKKFYVNVWRYQHRAVFYHRVNNNQAIIMSYSEDALRNVFQKTLDEFSIELPFETPKRRFFMARHFVNEEDNVRCEGEGEVVLRANWRILKDIALCGLPFELCFKNQKTPYGIKVSDEMNMFVQICENTFNDTTQIRRDVNNTLQNMMIMPPQIINGTYL